MKWLLVCISLLFVACQVDKGKQMDLNEEVLFVGTYTQKEGHVDGHGEGVYVYTMNKNTGALTYRNVSDFVVSPSYLAVHTNGESVYAVNEFDGGEAGLAKLSAFTFDRNDFSLKLLNQVSSMGQYPCHISIDNSGKFVLAANYVGGSVGLFPIKDKGYLEEHTSFYQHAGGSSHPIQEAPHAHQILQHPSLGFVAAIDLGADRIYEYKVDSASQGLVYVNDYPNSPRMSGPRHMAFHPSLEVGYTLNELTGSVEVLGLNDTIRFRRSFQILSTLAEGDDREPASAAIKVHPSGRFLYASNRGEINEIVIFSIGEKGELSLAGRQSTLGEVPRDFEIDPSGRFLLVANQDSDTIVTFSIDQETGLLTETGYVAEVPTPVCLKFLGD